MPSSPARFTGRAILGEFALRVRAHSRGDITDLQSGDETGQAVAHQVVDARSAGCEEANESAAISTGQAEIAAASPRSTSPTTYRALAHAGVTHLVGSTLLRAFAGLAHPIGKVADIAIDVAVSLTVASWIAAALSGTLTVSALLAGRAVGTRCTRNALTVGTNEVAAVCARRALWLSGSTAATVTETDFAHGTVVVVETGDTLLRCKAAKTSNQAILVT
jgi:hypothetical protein